MPPHHKTERTPAYDRRSVMAMVGSGVAVASLSGCLGDDDDDDDDDDNGVTAEPGEPVELVLHAPQFRTYDEEMRHIADDWERELGVDVTLETREWSTHLAEIYGGDFSGAGFTSEGSTPGRVDPQRYLSSWISDNIPNPNRAQYSNSEYDEIFEELVATFDTDERNELIEELQEILVEDLPFIGHGWPPFVSPVNTELWDFPPMEFLGASSFNSVGIYEAEPLTDETTLVLGFVGDIDTGNPVGLEESGVTNLLQLVFDSPRAINLEGEFVDWACETEEIDETTFELTLADGLDEFTDGSDLGASDLAFTFNFMAEHGPGEYGPLTGTIDEAEVVDERTVEVNLTTPDFTFLTSTLSYFPILPEHVWEDVPAEGETVETDVLDIDDIFGAGPFTLEEWSTERMVFEANDDYFQGPPGPDELILASRGSNDALRTDMVGGEIHASHTIVPPTIAEQIVEGNDDITLHTTESVHFEHISLNIENEPLDDVAFREALAHAIDIESFGEIFYLGDFTPGNNTPVHPVHDWGNDDFPTIDEMFDPDEAQNILEDAGYTWDDDDRLLFPE